MVHCRHLREFWVACSSLSFHQWIPTIRVYLNRDMNQLKLNILFKMHNHQEKHSQMKKKKNELLFKSLVQKVTVINGASSRWVSDFFNRTQKMSMLVLMINLRRFNASCDMLLISDCILSLLERWQGKQCFLEHLGEYPFSQLSVSSHKKSFKKNTYHS